MTRKAALRRTFRGRETFYGNVENTEDALRVIGACSEGVLKRAMVRLAAEECTAIRPGSVFVFDEEESGIKRWTDGKVWSPSRILGNWLVYRELERKIGRRAGGGPSCSGVPKELKNSGLQVIGSTKGTFVVKGSGGLIKKTFSVPNGDSTTHLVVYLPNENSPPHNLRQPSDFPELARIQVQQETVQAQRFRRRKPSPLSSFRKGKRLGCRKPASIKQRKPSKRARDAVSDIESDESAASSSPKRRPTLRPLPARNKGKDFYREGETESESSSGSEYVGSDDDNDFIESSPECREPSPERTVPEQSRECVVAKPIKARIPVRRMSLNSNASLLAGEQQVRCESGTYVEAEDITDSSAAHHREDGDHRERSDKHNQSSRNEEDNGNATGATYSPASANASHTVPVVVQVSEFGRTTPPILSSASNPYFFDSDADYDEHLLSGNPMSTDIGSEDSSFIVEYMCSRGYSQQQFISPSFEPDLPMLEA